MQIENFQQAIADRISRFGTVVEKLKNNYSCVGDAGELEVL
jgi:hypothetical protein